MEVLLILTLEVFHFFWSVFRVWFCFFLLLLLSVSVWVCVGVRGCARGVRVLACVLRDAPLYIPV